MHFNQQQSPANEQTGIIRNSFLTKKKEMD